MSSKCFEIVTNTVQLLSEAAFQQWQAGNRNIFLTFGDVGVTRSEITGDYYGGFGLWIKDIPQVELQGRIVSPVVRLPEHPVFRSNHEDLTVSVFDPLFWLDDIKKAGVDFIYIDNLSNTSLFD
ncbi:MAG: hypothetical protein HND45_13960 [Chloroflexi bacterium]|nr:hypothetical protein [Chloroflexota bacterium]WKZ53572.1 MAG: hypothetical protein QY324_12125 [Anaerolineales bacterium]GIK11283.1 MAG: hypothetical protein BroJett001_33490 [Chloroflexota bacterium]